MAQWKSRMNGCLRPKDRVIESRLIVPSGANCSFGGDSNIAQSYFEMQTAVWGNFGI
jgi:hypothetical protein